MFNGGRQPSCGGTSRMNREVHVRFREGLGVKFPGPTRQNRLSRSVPLPLPVGRKGQEAELRRSRSRCLAQPYCAGVCAIAQPGYSAQAAATDPGPATGSRIDGSSFSGLLTRVDIGHMRSRSDGNGFSASRGLGSSPSHRP
jgi:hypothetical protein